MIRDKQQRPLSATKNTSAAALAAREAALKREKEAELAKQPKKKPLSEMKIAGEFSSLKMEAEREMNMERLKAEREGSRIASAAEGDEGKKKVSLSPETLALLKQINFGILRTAAYRIHSECGSDHDDSESVGAKCVDLVGKYIDNIVKDPSCEKFQKIRVANKMFQERVASCKGGVQFLEGMGFFRILERSVSNCGDRGEEEEYFYVIPKSKCIPEELSDYKQILNDKEGNSAPFPPHLYREVSVLTASEQSSALYFDIPASFFKHTVDDVRREQLSRQQHLQHMQEMRTRAQREIDSRGGVAACGIDSYLFTKIRVRLPDGVYLQGTFKTGERMEYLCDFITCSLHPSVRNLEFKLISHAEGVTINSGNEDDLAVTFRDLKIVPSAVLNLKFSSDDASLQGVSDYLIDDLIQEMITV